MRRLGVLLGAAALATACGKDDGRTGGPVGPGLGSLSVGDGGTSADDPVGDDDDDDDDDDDAATSGDDDDDDDGPIFDVGSNDEGGTGVEDSCGTECECTIPDHVPCDAGTNDLFNAVGLNCPGELQVTTSTMGPAAAMGIRSSFGTVGTFNAREGEVYAVIGSGNVAELDSVTPAGDSDAFPTHCNDDIGAFDPGGALPAPIQVNNVGAMDCAADPTLVGTGDCSNTIQGQFDQGNSANDYVEMRIELDVPVDVVSFSYDFAFFSTEYPFYSGSAFNDMYIGWLESEQWTGNISFDAAGNPISLNAGFLEYTDDAGTAPELAGTCMRQHAGTSWLSTSVGVTPGEHITAVFAIFDLSDSILDSYAFIDNFQWGCDPTGGPITEPEG